MSAAFVRRSLLVIALPCLAGAQALPPIRALGGVLNTSREPLGSILQVRALSGGRVLVNDSRDRRVVLFDSTLRVITIVADSTAATGNAYGSRVGGLIASRGDSTLFVDPGSLSMLVIDGSGKIVRTMAAPRPSDVNGLVGGPFGTPAFDSRGRLVYRSIVRSGILGRQAMGALLLPADSSLIVRYNFASRAVDTVAKYRIPEIRFNSVTVQVNGRTVTGPVTIVNPLPWTDDWAVLADGTIAVVRGQDYRVDLIDEDDKVTPGPKLQFEWRRLTDSDKTALVDSLKAEVENAEAARLAAAGTHDSSQNTGSSRAGRTVPISAVPSPLQFVPLAEMPDYRPAFRQGAARGDLDGRLWIRTSQIIDGSAIYNVISKDGILVDRVQVPPWRVIVGFGAGDVVYMGVVDGSTVRLERARAH